MNFFDLLEAAIPALRRYARALLGDPDAAEDLVQDSLERAISRRHLWRHHGSMRAWLFRIMHNLHVNQQRARRLRPTGTPLDELVDPPSQAERQTGHLELLELQRAIEELPEEQRAVLLLVALEGLSYREVAEVLAIPIGTVMSRLSRARARLSERLTGSRRPHLRRIK